MLARYQRLKKKNDFERVFKGGKTIKGPLLVLKIISNTYNYSRFGIVVSQKISKKAVIRNKVRRRINALIKKMTNIKTGKDVVIITLPGIEKKDFNQLKKDVEEGFLKAGVNKK